MRRCAQASQRSTWPPNAAVRQRSIADMTLSWPRLTWPAWEARQAGPRWRKMSATSTASRDNGRASAGHLQQKVERACHLAECADGDAGVERRGVELLVSEQRPGLRRGRLVWDFDLSRAASVSTITAWQVDRLQLLEVEFDDGLQLVGERRAFEIR